MSKSKRKFRKRKAIPDHLDMYHVTSFGQTIEYTHIHSEAVKAYDKCQSSETKMFRVKRPSGRSYLMMEKNGLEDLNISQSIHPLTQRMCDLLGVPVTLHG